MAAQLSHSRFLSALPKEIRLQMYDYVLGQRLIHITNSTAHPASPRISYTVCTASQCGENDAYDLSTSWTDSACEPDALPSWEEVYYVPDNKVWLKEYSVRHSRCLSLLRSFRSRTYDPMLYKANAGYEVEHGRPESDLPLYQQRCRPNACPGDPNNMAGGNQCEHRRDLALRFGQAGPRAFRQLHPRSFLELSNLLLVSQHVYQEARLVPFTSNTFVLHVDNANDVAAILQGDNFLPWQQNAIQHIAIQGHAAIQPSGFGIRLLSQAVELLAGLQKFSLSTNCPPGADLASFLFEDAIERNIELPLVARARVIIGDDHPGTWRSRSERREQARRVETLLAKSTLQDDARWYDTAADDENLGNVQDLELELERLQIPKLPWPRPAEFTAHWKYNRPFGAGN